MKYFERLKLARDHRKLTQEELATAIGVSQQTIQKLEKRGQSSAYTNKIAKVLEISSDWLADEIGPMQFEQTLHINDSIGTHNISKNQLPYLDWSQILNYCQTNKYKESISVSSNHSEKAFVFKVTDDSMQSPTKPYFHEGQLLIVEPKSEFKSGSFIIAQFGKTDRITFKQLIQDGDQFYLRALNPTYRNIDMNDNVHILGVVVGLYMDFK